MSPMRIIAFILVIGWSLAQSLPQPIKSQIALGASSETEMIVTAVVVKHLPNTDQIAAAWQVRNLNQNSSWAYVRGAVASTSGDIIKQFDVSTETTLGFQTFSAPLLVALADGGFAVFYYNALPGNYYYMRRYNSALNPVSEPILVAITYKCIQPTAVIDTNGDIIMACPRLGSANFLVYRLNSTGHVLNWMMHPVSYQNVHPSMALSGDTIAISMIRAVNTELLDLRLYFLVLDKNFNVLQEFTPFVNNTLVLTASTTATINEPDTFSAIAMGLDAENYFLYTVKFNSTSILTQNTATIPVYLQAIGTSLNADGSCTINITCHDTNASCSTGEGLVFCSAVTPSSYVTFPLAQVDGGQIFAMNQTDFHAVHTITAAEGAIDTFPYADVVNSVTTWATGGAVAWPEISSTSGLHYARITMYGTLCGDYFTEGPEQCDGGLDCRSDCTCPAGQISDTRSGCITQPVAVPKSQTTPMTPVNPPLSMSSSRTLNSSVLLPVLAGLIVVFLL